MTLPHTFPVVSRQVNEANHVLSLLVHMGSGNLDWAGRKKPTPTPLP